MDFQSCFSYEKQIGNTLQSISITKVYEHDAKPNFILTEFSIVFDKKYKLSRDNLIKQLFYILLYLNYNLLIKLKEKIPLNLEFTGEY